MKFIDNAERRPKFGLDKKQVVKNLNFSLEIQYSLKCYLGNNSQLKLFNACCIMRQIMSFKFSMRITCY